MQLCSIIHQLFGYVCAIWTSKQIWKLGEGAKIATVILQMDNFGTRNFDGAKPYIRKQNGTNLALLNRGVKFDR